MRNKLVAVLMASLAFMLFISGQALAAWPTQAEWIPSVYGNWGYISDEPVSKGFAYEDLVPDITHPTQSATYWYFDGTDVYFRIILNGNPLRSNPTRFVDYYWHAALSTDADDYPEFMVTVDGRSNPDRILVQYNNGNDSAMDGDAGYVISQSSNPYTSSSEGILYTYLIEGNARSAVVPGSNQDNTPDYYLDFKVPLSALQRQNSSNPAPMLPYTATKIAYGSSNDLRSIATDLAGPGSGFNLQNFFAGVPSAPFDSVVHGGYGVLRDTRNPASSGQGGVWTIGEAVQFSGYGWPTSSSSLYRSNLPVRIEASTGVLVWSGNLPCTTTGQVNATATWSIPASAAAGVYYVYVSDPRNISSFKLKDVFTVGIPVDLSSSSKQVNKTEALEGDELTYTITVSNNGTSSATGIIVTDVVPVSTDYVTGSTTLNGTVIPDVAGMTPLTTGYGLPQIQPGTFVTLAFSVRVKSSLQDGTEIENVARIAHSSATLERRASVIVKAPVLSFQKSVDKSTAVPSDILTYSITLTNSGSATASGIVLTDSAPAGTSYVASSTTADGLQLPDTTGASPLAAGFPVPSIAPGQSRTYTFKASLSSSSQDGDSIANVAHMLFRGQLTQRDAMTQVKAPVLSMTKKVFPTWQASPGTILTYQVTITNIGHSNAVSVEINDILPEDLVYISGSASCSHASGVLTYRHEASGVFDVSDTLPVIEIKCALPVLAPGESLSFTFRASIR